jgi:hypothetical protein
MLNVLMYFLKTMHCFTNMKVVLYCHKAKCIIKGDWAMMKRLTNICGLLLLSSIMFIFMGCSANIKESSNAESVITEYVNTYYTITKDDIELYKKITGGNKDGNVLDSYTNKANKEFKNLMTDAAYADITATRMSYGRCKEAAENNYYVTVKSINLEKYSEDTQTQVYYYDIELIQTPILGNEVKSIKDKKQITVSMINGNWKVSNSFLDGY